MTEAQQIAADLKADGQAMTLTRVGAGTYDPVTGTTTGGVTQTWTVYGLILEYKDSDINAPNSLIAAGDEKILMGHYGVRPMQGDSLTFNSELYSVISVKRKRPQGVDLFYYCQVRK